MTYNHTGSGGILAAGSSSIYGVYSRSTSGGVKISGCWPIVVSHIYTTQYGVSDIVYNVRKARKGVLEKIVIKEIVPVKMSLTGGQFLAMYRDTLNGLWNERDLVSSATAVALAEDYYVDLLEKITIFEAKAPCN